MTHLHSSATRQSTAFLIADAALEDDVLTPTAFAAAYGSRVRWPTQRLALAELIDVLAILNDHRVTSRVERQQALHWVKFKVGSLTFVDCCHALNFDVEWLRAGILHAARRRTFAFTREAMPR